MSSASAVVRRSLIDAVRVRMHGVFRSVFSFVNKGMHTMSLVARVSRTGVRVVLVRPLVSVRAVPVMLVFVLHRRMTSAGMMHAAPFCVPFRMTRLGKLLVLIDRSAVWFLRHGCDLVRVWCPARA
jgi:hypothetical protein